MKNKTKRFLYKCSVVFFVFVTIFIVTASCCFGASLTYPPELEAVNIDKTNWADPNFNIQGTDFYRPNFYLDDINFTSSSPGFDDVAGGTFSPSQVCIGNPFYRYVPKLRYADKINTRLNYNGQLDFVNSTEQWEEGWTPIDFYQYDITYDYTAFHNGERGLVATFDTGFSLQNASNYASFEFSNIVMNGTSLHGVYSASIPYVFVGFQNLTGEEVDYRRIVTIEYEALNPVKIDGEWTYQREYKQQQYFDNLGSSFDEDFTSIYNLFTDTQALYELRSSEVKVVRDDTVQTSNYIFIKRLIVEYEAFNPEVRVARLYTQTENLFEDNVYRNTFADYQEYIGDYTVVEVEYDYDIDFTDFINSVASIFNIEIFLGFTLLDILTGVIGVFILIWFLKVFAGG